MHTDIVTIAAAKAVTRAAVRGTAAVIVVQITSNNATVFTETDTGAMMWAKLLVAIIVLLGGIQTGVCGIHTTRSRTAIIGPSRQCDYRVLYFIRLSYSHRKGKCTTRVHSHTYVDDRDDDYITDAHRPDSRAHRSISVHRFSFVQ